MDESAAAGPVRCPRCHLPLPPKATRCEDCGRAIKRPTDIRLYLGMLGLVLFLAMAFVGFRLMQSNGFRTDSHASQDALPPEEKPALGQ